MALFMIKKRTKSLLIVMIYASLTLLIYKEKRNQAKFHAFILHYAHLILSLHREKYKHGDSLCPFAGIHGF
jgi:hypothetical protein